MSAERQQEGECMFGYGMLGVNRYIADGNVIRLTIFPVDLIDARGSKCN